MEREILLVIELRVCLFALFFFLYSELFSSTRVYKIPVLCEKQQMVGNNEQVK